MLALTTAIANSRELQLTIPTSVSVFVARQQFFACDGGILLS